MNTTVTKFGAIGIRIRKARKEQGLTQEQLGSPQFTKGYISALERGSVRPSLKALEFIANRLELPLAYLVAVAQESDGNSDRDRELESVQEELNYRYNYAHMLIREAGNDSLEEALTLIQAAEESARAYQYRLPARIRYRAPYLRGQAYLKADEPGPGIHELEQALAATLSGPGSPDPYAEAMARNTLGLAFYEWNKPKSAYEQHAMCLRTIETGAVKDPQLHLSVLHNLANDYMALNDQEHAKEAYRKALAYADDVDGPERQAQIYWDLATKLRAADDWEGAKMYATQALHVFEAVDTWTSAASMCIHLGRMLSGEKRYGEARELLRQAEPLLKGTNNTALLGSLYSEYADLDRREGNLEQAAQWAMRSLELLGVAVSEADAEIRGGAGKERELGKRGNTKAKHGGRRGMVGSPDYPNANLAGSQAEALHSTALIEEALGNLAKADEYFEQALKLAEEASLSEILRMVSYSYGEALRTRGAFEKAAKYYRLAAQAGLLPSMKSDRSS
ncbi:MAG: helix-turn-helix transcriptional regulator, partial [Chloroflexia bacterium]